MPGYTLERSGQTDRFHQPLYNIIDSNKVVVKQDLTPKQIIVWFGITVSPAQIDDAVRNLYRSYRGRYSSLPSPEHIWLEQYLQSNKQTIQKGYDVQAVVVEEPKLTRQKTVRTLIREEFDGGVAQGKFKRVRSTNSASEDGGQ